MVLGPHPTDAQHPDADGPGRDPRSPAGGQASLAVRAREIGRRLVADLERAEALSSGWADEKLGYALVSSAMDRALDHLTAIDCWGKENQLPSGEFWAAAGSLLVVGWLHERARFKPRGYAGDFEMFERFWQRTCVAHPLGRLFDRYFQGQAAVEAVRARTERSAATLVERCLAAPTGRAFHVVSVGCGPGLDVRLALDSLPVSDRRRVRLTLLDLDQAALDRAQECLTTLIDAGQLVTLRENLFRLVDKPRAAEVLAEADFLLCSGLFDYLPDEAAAKLLRLFWQRLAGGGMLSVGNFAPHNPTRAYMEWIGNWYLIYRTAADLERLALTAGLPRASFTVVAERLGIDLFLHAENG
ncbi:MAG TPA: class I SAM-dependent methyltransferase [Pirellulales bacterium]|nr:class I SAM-dependent methyltransferase [Pirellulales bacterium]